MDLAEFFCKGSDFLLINQIKCKKYAPQQQRRQMKTLFGNYIRIDTTMVDMTRVIQINNTNNFFSTTCAAINFLPRFMSTGIFNQIKCKKYAPQQQRRQMKTLFGNYIRIDTTMVDMTRVIQINNTNNFFSTTCAAINFLPRFTERTRSTAVHMTAECGLKARG